MKHITFLSLLVIFPLAAFGQQDLPETQDVQIEVLTSELLVTSKAQNVKLQITCNAAAAGQQLRLELDGVKGVLVPVKADRDDAALWLFKAAEANDNALVLAWDNPEEEQLNLAPGAWDTPYVLNLELQVSFSNLMEVPTISETAIDLTVVNGASQNRAATTGRGNQISLKNSRE